MFTALVTHSLFTHLSCNSQVSIDAAGLLKVTHMLGLEVAPGGRLAQDHPSALLESQVGTGARGEAGERRTVGSVQGVSLA